MARQHPRHTSPQPHNHCLLPMVSAGLTDKHRRRIEETIEQSAPANTRVKCR